MYEKQVWEDRQVEFPMTFTMTQNDNGTITLTPYPGVVSNEGTKFTAARMNNIENGIANGVVPTGCILPFCGNNAPQGWLLCDGSAINRTTYADLFAILGTNYGEGDNSTTFNLPDMRGKVAVGLNTNGAFDALGKSVGEETHKLTINEMPSHDHKPNRDGYGFMVYRSGASRPLLQRGGDRYGIVAENQDDVNYANDVTNTGGNQAHNNIQPSLVFNYIIKT